MGLCGFGDAGECADGFGAFLRLFGWPKWAWEGEFCVAVAAVASKENEAPVDFAGAFDARDDFLTDVAAFLVVDGAGF